MKCLSELNREQKEAVMHGEGPLLILAGAGSGKTKTLTYRIAHLIKTLGVKPSEILAVTCTNKAAGEMVKRVEHLIGSSARGMWISTFHSACARMLRENCGHMGYGSNFNIIDAADSVGMIKTCMLDLGISDRLFSPRQMASMISSAKGLIITPDEYTAKAQPFGYESKVAKVYPVYQERLKSSGVLDFDDLLMLAVQLLEGNRKVLLSYQDRFRHILVDEYQDTNRAQYRLIKLLAGKTKNVCVVGDDDQSIYGWRGADIRNILEFEKDYPDAKVVKLEQNYRSTQRILDSAWSLVCNNPGRRPKKLWTRLGEGEKIEYVRVADEAAEASCIAREISKEAKAGYVYSDFAVLYRTNTQSRTIEEAFRKEGIPYVVVGGMKFYDRKEIKDIITYLKVISNPRDSVSLKRIVNTPPRGIGEATMKKTLGLSTPDNRPLIDCLRMLLDDEAMSAGPKRRISEFLDMIDKLVEEKKDLTPRELADKVISQTKYVAHIKESHGIEAPGKIDNIKEFLSSLEKYEEENENPALEDYLAQVALITDWDSAKAGSPAVTLMTLHLSKGLEFPVVFIAGMEDGLIPHAQSKCDDKEMEEERRLLYVGMTRAKKKLYLLSSITRRLAGLTQSNRPSMFLDEIPQELMQCRKISRQIKQELYMPGMKFASRQAPSPCKSDFVACLFKNGTQVQHPTWGSGIVEKTEGKGEDQKVIVQFKSVGKKKLLTRVANLTRG
ncbi:MAG: UvrD-helicase domain-containing protein [Nitrospirota bacterium]